ncbi:MAG: lipocalin family protein, partial [Desulfobacterales bacterium]|nr:lipocalin family protein [Desulfobacterales bacterium]MDX2511606.1 lipocalin family protein [Desulfobacterales bacterium]
MLEIATPSKVNIYGGYHVIALDQETYHYAMVAGPSRSYLWILSR